jgi:formylglycine-generating enzyme required for sulfatase activity
MTATDSETRQPYPAFALLGEPGAGKSTLLRKMARDAVKRHLKDASAPLPLFVSLSDHKKGDPLTFLREHWANQMGFDGLENALDTGRVWLFADGLNEMGRRGYETRIAQWRDFLRRRFQPGGNRAVIACRIADYGEGLALPRLIIHAMDETRIKNFLNKRIPERADALWDELEHDRVERRGDLYRLASIPFWLVMMASVAGRTGLPRNRAALLENFVSTWLDYENSRPGDHPITPEKRIQFVEALTRMAWRGLGRSQNYTFTRQEAFKFLAKTSAPQEWLHAAQSCSLLTDTGGGCRFQHQLLQEYFAGRELAQQFLKKRNLNRLWRIPWRKKWKFVRSRWDPLPDPPSTFWEEATVLAAGMLNSGEAERLTLAVLHHNPPLAARCNIESGAEMGEAVQKAVANRLRAQIENPRQRLAARLAAGKALGRLGDERILAKQGEAVLPSGKKVKFIEPDWVYVPAGIFQMGSDEKDKMASADERPAHPVTISRGYKIARFPVTVAEYRCFMDADGYKEKRFWPDEISQRWLLGKMKFEESYQFYLYNFIKERKESFLAYWGRQARIGSISPDDWQSFRELPEKPIEYYRESWEQQEAQKRDKTGRAQRPWLWDDPRYTIPNQPVIGICWYEARAYTLWLTDILRITSLVHVSEEIRLPTEAKWEYAARGVDGRLWPWGNRWKKEVCNSLEGRIQFPSPVGIYPLNASPCGVLDMAGNIWEWCADWYAEDTYEKRKDDKEVVDPSGPETGQLRVVRGGSWTRNRDHARCAYRNWYLPDDFLNNLGFRLVLSPI